MSIERPEEFWGQAAERIVWSKRFSKVLDTSNPPFTNWYWQKNPYILIVSFQLRNSRFFSRFPGGELNVCYNAIDRHVDEGRGGQTALIYDSPLTKTVRKFTYSELQDKVAKLARVLVTMGVKKGDRVLIYLPMIPEVC